MRSRQGGAEAGAELEEVGVVHPAVAVDVAQESVEYQVVVARLAVPAAVERLAVGADLTDPHRQPVVAVHQTAGGGQGASEVSRATVCVAVLPDRSTPRAMSPI